MTDWKTDTLVEADKKFVWHPFTNMRDWCAPEHEPLVLVEGRGAILRDSHGHEYIDGNSSIWTNIHGHNHPHINAAIRQQLDRVGHTSFLGFTNPPAVQLARAVVGLFSPGTLTRVFYSDDGSTGVEVALRIVDQYWRLRNSRRHQFIAFQHGYHGDTAGAAALGAAAMFQIGPSRWNFPAIQIPNLKALEQISATEIAKIAGVVIEPLIQGAAGMKLWPPLTLRAVREWCDRTGALLIVDEVMTGFGRTGKMFAIEHESVLPDIMVLGKGLTGGYLPLAITLVTDEIFSRFDGSAADGKALAYGHSYTGNPLGCAAALASLEIFELEGVLEKLQPKIEQMRAGLDSIRDLSGVHEIRQCGFISGIELAENGDIRSALGGSASPTCPPWRKTMVKPIAEGAGDGSRDAACVDLAAKVCAAARSHGLLTRPIRNVVVFMPPLCISPDELERAIAAIRLSIMETCGHAEKIAAR
jgi:adenosylmethionine-8-amino-7-oxononanoate aminotransferase